MQTRKTTLPLLLIVVLVASALGVTPRPAHAGSISSVWVTAVDNNNDTECSLRKAIVAINLQDFNKYPICKMDEATNTIVLPNALVILTVDNTTHYDGDGYIIDDPQWGDLDITRSINIKGSGPYSQVAWGSLSGGSDPLSPTVDRIFHIHPGANVTMEGFTISNGSAQKLDKEYRDGGGILNDGGNVTLINMKVQTNYAGYGRGGGVANKANSTLTVVNSTFTNNSASVGGGILNQGSATISTSLFDSNKTSTNQGVGISNIAPTSNLVNITNTTFASNNGNALENSGSMALTFLTIKGSGRYGLYLNAGSWTMLRGSILTNSASVGNQDCYRSDSGVYFLDGGYNLVATAPAGDAKCDFPNSTLVGVSPALSDTPVQIDPYALTNLYTFTMSAPEYNAIPISATGACDFAEIPAASMPAAGMTVPAAPGNDQLERTRPTSTGCDIGAYELGATRMSLFLPTVRRFY